jgi:short-subunit dehydrogenase
VPDRGLDTSKRPLAVITGASSGIGAMFARKLAARGYDLLLIARRRDRLQSLASELAELYHVKTEALEADLVNEDDLDRVAQRLRTAPNLGLLVNNAGFGIHGFFVEGEVRGQEEMHRLHVLATLRLTHAALVNLIPRATGGVINVSYAAGFMQAPQSISYNATKTWMNSFTEGLAMELAVKKSPVKVQALCPGFTLSEFHDTPILKMDRGTVWTSLWMTAEFVVEESLRGFDQGRLFVIPGWRYRMLVRLIKITPAGLLRKILTRARQPRK